jgi:hypothetical protein
LQSGYFDHRLRPKENILPIFLYLYLNPYKAGLTTVLKTWPWFMCGEEDRVWFSEYLDHGLPEPTWLHGLP